MVITQGLDRMKQARARLVLNQLFFGSASMGLRFVVDEKCQTAYTDAKIIGFSPDYINSLNLEHVETLICHGTLHAIMLHPLRLRGRDHKLANMAMDYAVNGICRRAGLKLHPNWLYDDKLSAAGMSFEAIYDILKKDRPPEPDKGQGPQGDGGGKKGPKGENDKGAGSGKDDENGAGEPDGAGDGAGEPEPWQAGEVREPKDDKGHALSESDIAQIEQEWKIAAAKALQQAQAAGKVPAGMERLVKDMTIKKRDLEDVLRDFVQKTLAGDYTYSRPNKRHIIRDIYLPSIRGEEIPMIAMVMDTSGSIGEEQIAYFTGKLNSILSEYNTTVQVVYCDTQAHDGGQFNNSDLPLRLKPIGGGGTDFRPAFKLLESLDIEPTCLIYYTDGYCDSFPSEPDYPVLWALYGAEREFPFGEPVVITPV